MSTAPLIRFSCPQGHRLSSPAQQAGRPGKCPKCGVSFMVPMTDNQPTVADTEHSPFAFLDAPTATDAPVAPAPDTQGSSSSGRLTPERPPGKTPSRPDMVVFLCPNGHRLNGPAKLAGRAGQCPHCGVKFIIPDADEPGEDAADEPGEPFAPAGFDFSELGSLTARARADESANIPLATATQTVSPSITITHQAPLAPLAGATRGLGHVHPMAALFARLWSHRGPGVTIELHLGEGKILLPDEFAAAASQHEVGIFAEREANGRTTVSAIRWDAIARVAVRGLAGTPTEFFPPGS